MASVIYERQDAYLTPEAGTRATVFFDPALDLRCEIEPSGLRGRSTSVFFHRGTKFLGGHMTTEDLNDLIGELQRARSGCFDGEWPRPAPPERDYELERLLAEEEEIERRSKKPVVVRANELVSYIEENFRFDQHLGIEQVDGGYYLVPVD